jgi:hypothetical protein
VRNEERGIKGGRRLVLACFLAGAGTLALGQAASVEREEFLRTAPVITVAKEESTGRTNAWKVYLNDGQQASRAIFKYIHRPRPTLLPSSYQYELAAYALNKLLGLDLVPVTVERAIDGRTGSLQCFCEGTMTEAFRRRQNLKPPDVSILQNAFSELGIFENLTNNPREDASDILINTKDWKVWRVDFSEAFAPDTVLLPDSPFPRCSKGLYAALRGISDDRIREQLKAYLNGEELEALLVRKRLILDRLDALIRDKGEEAVLF